MKIVLDCDEVILNTCAAIREWYLSDNPHLDIPWGTYASTWDVLGSGEERVTRFRKLFTDFYDTPHFTDVPVVDGAVEAIHMLKNMGHELYVLSGISSVPEICTKRARQLDILLGKGVLSDVVCIDPLASKKDALLKMKADLLLDDSMHNASTALELGIHALLFRCPENSSFVDVMFGAGKESSSGVWPQTYWKYDFEKVRKSAILINDWPHVIKVIQELSK